MSIHLGPITNEMRQALPLNEAALNANPKQAMDNLRRAFPGKTDDELRQWVRDRERDLFGGL